MNFITRTLIRRIPQTIIVFNKHYHCSSHIKATEFTSIGSLKYEQNIHSLIQKTIIPLNSVKPKPAILDLPCTNIIGFDYSLPEKIDKEPEKEISDPSKTQEKKAHRMLIIRRTKMNKHKHKKRLRKNKFHIAKRKRERRMTKEIQFRQEIAAKLQEVEKFDAETYVADRLKLYRQKILPNRIHGKLMPQFVIEDVLAKKEYKRQFIEECRERRRKFIAERGSLDVDVK